MNNPSSRFLYHLLSPLYGLCAVLSLLGPVDARGATYYVATTGNDSNPGTLSRPFKSFKQAIGLLQPGDTLYIRGGTYTEQLDFQGPNKSGTANGWITVAGYPGETVISQFAGGIAYSYGPIKARGNRGYFIFENLILDGINGAYSSGLQIRDGNHHFILRNVEFKNFQMSAMMIKASNVQIINCKIHDSVVDTVQDPPSRRYGIYLSSGDTVIIEGNNIYNNPGGGITVYPGPVHNAVIRNNVIHHNNWMANSNVPGIQLSPVLDHPTANGNGVIDGTQIYNNVVHSNCVNQPTGSKPCGGIEISNGATNTKVWNNTVYGNKGYGIRVASGSNGPTVNTVVQNNIVFENASGQIMNTGVDSIITHNLTTDPKFVKVETFDFRLQARSPAIDAGTDLNMVSVDIKNVSRPQGAAYDIGAYEGSVSGDSSPDTPKDLSLR